MPFQQLQALLNKKKYLSESTHLGKNDCALDNSALVSYKVGYWGSF